MKMEGLVVTQVDAISSNKLNAGKISTHGSINLRLPNALSLQPEGMVRSIYDDGYFDKIEQMSI
jgi:hypothetical protein